MSGDVKLRGRYFDFFTCVFFLTRQTRTGTPALQNNNETLQALFSDVCGSKKNARNRGDGDLKENLLYDYE